MNRSRERVAILGSGNWASAISCVIGRNTQRHNDVFEEVVPMWVYEEIVNGQKLSELINTTHENVKYLPGIKLPTNIRAVTSEYEAVKDATLLVICLPHQFAEGLVKRLKGRIQPNARVIHLLKGMSIDASTSSPILFSHLIRKELGVSDVCVLSGANIANLVASGPFSEATIGYSSSASSSSCSSSSASSTCEKVETAATTKTWHLLFNIPEFFSVNIVEDVEGVELCGALKNIVAVAAGFVDGLKYGANTKAAVMRIGLEEMKKFSQYFFPSVKDATFFESCGVADLIVTCFSGRNRKVAEAFVTANKSIEQLEKELLNGQKLQGTLTAAEVYEVLHKRGLTDRFPLFTAVYKICYEGAPPASITRIGSVQAPPPHITVARL
ncbi:glycerol-3-phosphate dehydrogenase [Balamuthia mandrillaris]